MPRYTLEKDTEYFVYVLWHGQTEWELWSEQKKWHECSDFELFFALESREFKRAYRREYNIHELQTRIREDKKDLGVLLNERQHSQIFGGF